jgi:ribosomal protein S18 acetylase RimI-like enzyme
MSGKGYPDIRRLTADSAREIVALHRRCFAADALMYSIYASDKIGEFIAATARSDGNEFLGVFSGEALVGYAHIRSVEDRAHLNYIAVSESNRRRGIGGMVVERVITDARKSGCRSISLDVAANDRNLRAWYEVRGFMQSAPESLSALISMTATNLTGPSAAISVTRDQWRRFQAYGLSEIDVWIEGDSFRVGLLGDRLFRYSGSPERGLVAALREFDRCRDLLVTTAEPGNIDFNYQIVGRSVSMELRL